VPAPGPDVFIIDFTPEKTQALVLSRCFRDRGWSVARDSISRPLEESLVYARQQRARWALVIAGPGAEGADRVRMLDLETGGEQTVAVPDLLAHPARYFPGL
jgi:histidyl-tRNA synthetase